MNIMTNIIFYILGVILILTAAVVGLYVGVYVLMYKTIIVFIAHPGFWPFIWALIKWGLAGFVGWAIFVLIALIGGALIGKASE